MFYRMVDRYILSVFLYVSVCCNCSASLENIIINNKYVYRLQKTKKSSAIVTCESLIRDAEIKYGIPKGLLKAIALIESGRKISTNSKKLSVWPWTINADGKSYFLNSKNEAIEKVIKLKKNGAKFIDVGCMQVNLHYHKDAFKNLDEAFSPQKNIEYAAKYLTSLKTQLNSWKMAVCYYHSQCSKHYIPYCSAVLANYKYTSKENFNTGEKIDLVKLLTNQKAWEYEFFTDRHKLAEIDKKISERLLKLSKAANDKN